MRLRVFFRLDWRLPSASLSIHLSPPSPYFTIKHLYLNLTYTFVWAHLNKNALRHFYKTSSGWWKKGACAWTWAHTERLSATLKFSWISLLLRHLRRCLLPQDLTLYGDGHAALYTWQKKQIASRCSFPMAHFSETRVGINVIRSQCLVRSPEALTVEVVIHRITFVFLASSSCISVFPFYKPSLNSCLS